MKLKRLRNDYTEALEYYNTRISTMNHDIESAINSVMVMSNSIEILDLKDEKEISKMKSELYHVRLNLKDLDSSTKLRYKPVKI
jgi:hypothetical protein